MLEVKYNGQPTNTHLCIAMLDSSSAQMSAKGKRVELFAMFMLLVSQLKTEYNFSETTLIRGILENPDNFVEKATKIDMTELMKQSGK